MATRAKRWTGLLPWLRKVDSTFEQRVAVRAWMAFRSDHEVTEAEMSATGELELTLERYINERTKIRIDPSGQSSVFDEDKDAWVDSERSHSASEGWCFTPKIG